MGEPAYTSKTTHRSQKNSVLNKASPKTMKSGASYLPRPLELVPTLSLFAIKGWACSNDLFNLSKEEGGFRRWIPY